jgi:hypothetical protein
MQTFVPLADGYGRCAEVLDNKRLGKQRVECMQIVKALVLPDYGWKNHPAVKMWAKDLAGLIAYADAVCLEWSHVRGYKDTCQQKIHAIMREADLPYFELGSSYPEWWGNELVHASHRANLLHKDPDWYGQWGWNEEPTTGYYWPI